MVVLNSWKEFNTRYIDDGLSEYNDARNSTIKQSNFVYFSIRPPSRNEERETAKTTASYVC